MLGRQFSIITDEPLFRAYHTVMEGNNEVDLDGRVRALDYLGTEDSFTFSWGFQEFYAGPHAGMTLVEAGDTNRLSVYRFHDHLPIPFGESLTWSIDWTQERFFTKSPDWKAAVEADGCWVDYATVFYWYQDEPAGYAHAPLPPPGRAPQGPAPLVGADHRTSPPISPRRPVTRTSSIPSTAPRT